MSRGRIYAGKAVILIEAEDRIDSTLRKVQGRLYKMQNTMGQIGRTALTGGIFSATGQGLLLRSFAKYSDLILELRVKMGLLGKQTRQQEADFNRLEKRIRSLGKSTSFTTEQVTEGAIRLAQAGFSGKEIEDMLQSVLDLARGTRTDLAEAARVAANTIRTFRLEASDSAAILSQFVSAARMGTVELDDLAESMKYASSTANQLGVKLPTLLSFFTLLSERGMRGSIAGTSTNTFLANIIKKRGEIEQMIGAPLAMNANGLDLFGVLQQLANASRQYDKAGKLGQFQDFFNLRGSRAALPLANDQDIKRLEQLEKQLISSQEEARRAAQVMDSGLGGSFRRATSAAKDFIITLGEIQEGPLKGLLDTIPPIANALSVLAAQNQAVVLTLAALPAVATAAGAGLLAMSFGMRQIAGLIGPVRSILGGGFKIAQGGLIGNLAGRAGNIKNLKNAKIVSGLASMGKYPVGAASATGITRGRQMASAMRMQTFATSLAAPQSVGKAVTSGMANVVNFSKTPGVARTAGTVGIGQYFNKEGLDRLRKEQQVVERKLQRAAKLGNVKEASRLGAANKVMKDRLAAAARSPKQLPFAPISGLSNNLARGSKNLPFLSIDDLGATVQGRATPIQRGMMADYSKIGRAAPKASGGLGKLLGRMGGGLFKGLGTVGKGISGFATGLFKVGKALSNLNVWMWVLQAILVFGDRIPGISGALSSVSSAFSQFFGAFQGITTKMAPAFDLINQSFGLLSNDKTKGLRYGRYQNRYHGLVQIVGGTFVNAWGRVKEQLGGVWNLLKRIVGTIWELGKAILSISVTSIGNIIGSKLNNIVGAIGNFGSMFGGTGEGMLDTIKGFAANTAYLVAKLFEWVGWFLMKFENMWRWAMEELELTMYRAIELLPFSKDVGKNMNNVQGRRSAREAQFDADVAKNAATVEKMMSNILNLMNTDTTASGINDQAVGRNMVGATQQRMFTAINNLQVAANRLLKPEPRKGGPDQLPPGMASGPNQQTLQYVRKVVAAVVGSAAATRGNTIRGVTEDELKRQTEWLKRIENNTRASEPAFE